MFFIRFFQALCKSLKNTGHLSMTKQNIYARSLFPINFQLCRSLKLEETNQRFKLLHIDIIAQKAEAIKTNGASHMDFGVRNKWQASQECFGFIVCQLSVIHYLFYLVHQRESKFTAFVLRHKLKSKQKLHYQWFLGWSNAFDQFLIQKRVLQQRSKVKFKSQADQSKRMYLNDSSYSNPALFKYVVQFVYFQQKSANLLSVGQLQQYDKQNQMSRINEKCFCKHFGLENIPRVVFQEGIPYYKSI